MHKRVPNIAKQEEIAFNETEKFLPKEELGKMEKHNYGKRRKPCKRGI